MRGTAIFLVFAYHCLVTVYWPVYGDAELKWVGWFRDFHAPSMLLALFPFTLGWTGVPIFFVISGFCIHLSHERSRKKRWKVFFLRRFFRIYPPYLASLLLFGLAFPWTRLHFTANTLHIHAEWFYSVVQLGIHLLLVHNFSQIALGAINPAYWSIAVEVQLYLLYPLLHWIFKIKSPWQALWITGAIEIGLRAMEALLILHNPDIIIPKWYACNPFTFWFSWTMGAVLAEAYLRGRPLPFHHPLFVWPLVFLACYSVKPLEPFCFMLSALGTASLISFFLARRDSPAPGRVGLISRHLRFAGMVSYSAYLIHMPLLYAVPDTVRYLFPGHHLHAPLFLACCFVAWIPVLALSWLMYRWVELPSIGWGKRVIRQTAE